MNFLLESLLEQGLLKAGNFRRAENKFKYVYLLTPPRASEKGSASPVPISPARRRNTRPCKRK